MTITQDTQDKSSLLSMLKWMVAFHQEGNAKALIDAEPINQAKKLIKRIESKTKSKTKSKTLEDLLETWEVLAPNQWYNDVGPKDWFAVCNNIDIVAYFADEKAAFRFRMAEINRELNG